MFANWIFYNGSICSVNAHVPQQCSSFANTAEWNRPFYYRIVVNVAPKKKTHTNTRPYARVILDLHLHISQKKKTEQKNWYIWENEYFGGYRTEGRQTAYIAISRIWNRISSTRPIVWLVSVHCTAMLSCIWLNLQLIYDWKSSWYRHIQHTHTHTSTHKTTRWRCWWWGENSWD